MPPDQIWGRLQVVINNVDVTFFRNVPVQVKSWASSEPFGDSVAEIYFPQISPFDTTTSIPWAANGGEHVEIARVDSGGAVTRLWSGLLVSPEDNIGQTETGQTFHAIGVLFQADLYTQLPAFWTGAKDIGTVIADALNAPYSRDYGQCPTVVTGITTRQRGGGGTPLLTGYIQDLLATATVSDGSNQWTVTQDSSRWTPTIALKDRTTVNATITAGTPGVELRLTKDYTQAANVIYTEGIATDGSYHRGTRYPNLRASTAPVYPGVAYVAGSGTTGFDPFADEMRRGGYTMASGDTYSTSDVAEVRSAQQRAGITVDGIVGGQTWNAVFQVGSNGYNLLGAYYEPAAIDTRVEPNLYNGTGAIIGANPLFEPNRLRVERFENMGEGISRKQAKASAAAELARTYPAGLSGSVVLTVDPEQIGRLDLRAGMNLQIKQYRGATKLLHISGVTVDWPNLSVTLEVDEYARDLLTLAGVRSRNKDAALDPARRVSTGKRHSRNSADQVIVFDSEAGAGRIPTHTIQGGFWTVLRIPGGEVGTIGRATYTSTSPASKFAVGVFSQPITSNQLLALVGDPLSSSSAWRTQSTALLSAGLLIAWGSIDQAMGYYPAAQSDTPAPSITGRFEDIGGFQYTSTVPPWLWVAEWSPVTTTLVGRMYVAPAYT